MIVVNIKKYLLHGDIHGAYSLFIKALKDQGFNPEEDLCVCTGDLIDRGKESYLTPNLINEPWFETVIGNHEEFCIKGLNDSYTENIHSVSNNGGAWFYELPYKDRVQIVSLFQSLPYAIQLNLENKKLGIVHADLPSDDWNEAVKLIEQNCYVDGRDPLAITTWSRATANKIQSNQFVDSIKNIDQLYLGHTVVKSPIISGNINLIDTGAVFTGNVTLIRVK